MCLLALTLAVPAWALSTKDLLSIIAMPLAVAAVSNVSGVQQQQLADLVSTLNQANVSPTQFVEVIRYVPVALVDQNGQPFIAYVREETTQGVSGDALVNAIADRLRTNYNVAPVLQLTGEPTAFVVQDSYIPASIPTPMTTDPLALIGLPLAVAAVSDISGIPQDQLANLVTTLNSANVPPAQMVEVIRYAPPALVVDTGRPFIQYVQQQAVQFTGPQLVPVVVQRLQTYYLPQQTQIVVATPPPQPVVITQNFVPPVVVTRVKEIRAHPNGGPPVHGENRGENRGRQFVPVPQQPAPVAAVPQARPREQRGEEHGRQQENRQQENRGQAPMMSSSPAPVAVAPPQARPQEQGKDKGEGRGQEKQKGGGKGHGKD